MLKVEINKAYSKLKGISNNNVIMGYIIKYI